MRAFGFLYVFLKQFYQASQKKFLGALWIGLRDFQSLS